MLKTTLTVTALAAALTLAAGSEKPLVDLETYDISKIQVIDFGPPLWVTPKTVHSDKVKIRKEKSSAGWVLDVTITDVTLDNPGILLPPPAGERYWNLSGYEHLYADIENMDHDQQMMLSVRITNPLVGRYEIANNSGFALNPGEKRTLRFYYPQADEFTRCRIDGLRATPPGIFGHKNVDPRRVDALIFWGHNLRGFSRNQSVHYRVGNIRLARPYRGPGAPVNDPEKFFPFVDRYGQYVHADWPDKIHSDSDFIRAVEREKKFNRPRLSGWNKYGGWAKGPQLKATGSFYVTKYEGKWFLVDPEGWLFFSHGVNAVTTQAKAKERRPFWYEKAAVRRPGGMLDFAEDNLKRKYGPEFRKRYPAVIADRFAAWGLNTLGCWSDPEILAERRTPYTLDFGLGGYRRTIKPVPGLPMGIWDPWDPGFAEALAKRGRSKVVAAAKDDPWCIGFFLINEIKWGDRTAAARAVLVSPADLPAKAAFVNMLRTKYQAIDLLNARWGTTYANWNAILTARKLPDAERSYEDLLQFNTIFIDRFYRICRDAVKSCAPNRLYFGSRFHIDLLPELYQAAAKYCDVVACNTYTWSVDGFRRQGLPDDKPILISEFHVGVLDRGTFNADSRPAGVDQNDRAHAYTRLLQGALLHPQIVGMHHFCWRDQPLTGRGDGENFAVGVVDNTDTPYWEFVDAMRKVGEHMIAYRLAGKFTCEWEPSK